MHTALSVLKALFEHYNFYSVVTTIACSQHPANSPLFFLSPFSLHCFLPSARDSALILVAVLYVLKKKKKKAEATTIMIFTHMNNLVGFMPGTKGTISMNLKRNFSINIHIHLRKCDYEIH